MKHAWLHRQQRRRLIVFCNGWGMDGAPFAPLGVAAYDVLMLSDYVDLGTDLDFPQLCGGYDEVSLVSWSMGVWVGQQLFSSFAGGFHRALAINGTLCPIHDQFGIPPQVYDATVTHWDEAARLKFYRRICRERHVIEGFFRHQPLRSVDNQAEELAALRRMTGCVSEERGIYTHVIITDQDLVMPSRHQLAFWKERTGRKRQVLAGSHFPFYRWRTWDELMAEVE